MSTEAIPEQSTLTVLAMKAIPVAHIQPVMATEAIFEHPALPVTAMEAVPKQPVVTAAEAFSESLSNIIKSTREIHFISLFVSYFILTIFIYIYTLSCFVS